MSYRRGGLAFGPEPIEVKDKDLTDELLDDPWLIVEDTKKQSAKMKEDAAAMSEAEKENEARAEQQAEQAEANRRAAAESGAAVTQTGDTVQPVQTNNPVAGEPDPNSDAALEPPPERVIAEPADPNYPGETVEERAARQG